MTSSETTYATGGTEARTGIQDQAQTLMNLQTEEQNQSGTIANLQAEGQNQTLAVSDLQANGQNLETLKVLVVDDEPGIRSGISRILGTYNVGFPFMEEDFHFEIREAGTGEEGLELMRKEPADLVLLDNNLPGMNGIEVLEQLNRMDRDIAVMMITSYASLDLAVKATDCGAYNFLPKPFTPQELKTAIEGVAKHLYLRRMASKIKEDGKQIRFKFLSVLSHELKSPINAVEGYLKIMLEKQAGDDIGEYMVMIERSLERIRGMRTMIKDLLDLTRYESSLDQRELEPVDLSEEGRRAIEQTELMARQKEVHVEYEAPEKLCMAGVANEIEIIFNNLLSNAIKYNNHGGRVFFRIEDNEHLVKITVRDTGIGMSREETEKLFHDFVRIKNRKTREISGSGLGLSITKKFVELYNGEISVSSEPDKGSTFNVILEKKPC